MCVCICFFICRANFEIKGVHKLMLRAQSTTKDYIRARNERQFSSYLFHYVRAWIKIGSVVWLYTCVAECAWYGSYISHWGAPFFDDVPLVEFIDGVFTRMPGGVTVSDSGLLLCPLSVERYQLPLSVDSKQALQALVCFRLQRFILRPTWLCVHVYVYLLNQFRDQKTLSYLE